MITKTCYKGSMTKSQSLTIKHKTNLLKIRDSAKDRQDRVSLMEVNLNS